jgi:hypothetical protein
MYLSAGRELSHCSSARAEKDAFRQSPRTFCRRPRCDGDLSLGRKALSHRVSGKIHQQPPVSLSGAFPRHFLDKANVLGKEHVLDAGLVGPPQQYARLPIVHGLAAESLNEPCSPLPDGTAGQASSGTRRPFLDAKKTSPGGPQAFCLTSP